MSKQYAKDPSHVTALEFDYTAFKNKQLQL